jgi:hypothetical protein
VRQRQVQKAPISIVHPVEDAFAQRVEAAAEALALIERRGQHEKLGTEDRYQRDRHKQRHRQRE